jgi:ATP-dependent protease ClpP protease subunit
MNTDDNKYTNWTHPAGCGWFQLAGQIDSAMAGNATAAMLKWLDDRNGKEGAGTYVIYLNTIGGYVGDAIAIRETMNVVRRSGHKVVVIVLRTGSCGNIVATAANEVYMGENSWWMTHALKSSADGEPRDLQTEAEYSTRLNAQTMGLMSSPQLKPAELTALVKDKGSVYFSAEDCWQHGLINGILREPEIPARRPV